MIGGYSICFVVGVIVLVVGLLWIVWHIPGDD